jgi:hypothetical protein
VQSVNCRSLSLFQLRWVGGSSVSCVARTIVLAAGIRAVMGRKAAARLSHKGKIYPHEKNDERGVEGGMLFSLQGHRHSL